MRDQNLAEENDIFEEEKGAHRKENLNLLRRQKELELEVEHLKGELQVCGHEKTEKLLSWLQMFVVVLLSCSSFRLQLKAVPCCVILLYSKLVGQRLGFPQCRARCQRCHMHGPGYTLTPLGVCTSLLLHLVQFVLRVLHFVIKNTLCC